MRKVSNKHYKK